MKIFKILIYLLFVYQIHSVYGILTTIDEIAALVNNHIILDSDVRKYMNIYQHNTTTTHQPLSTQSSFYQDTLNQLIINDLIFNAAQEEKIHIKNKKIDQTINDILHLRHITLHQFQKYLKKYGFSDMQYRTQLQQEITNRAICNNIVQQQAQITHNEIHDMIQILNTIDYNKQFEIIHITLPLPIQPTQNQIQIQKNLAISFIKNDNIHNNITELVNIYNSHHPIYQTITIKETTWISWKDMPIIFDQYLQTIQANDIIGPIHAYDGIHILKIKNIRYKKFMFPITKVKTKILYFKPLCNTHNVITNTILKIKTQVEHGDTTFDIINQEKSHNSYTTQYKKYLKWTDLNVFESNIQNALKNLRKQEISPPIYTDSGWCLVQLINVNNINYFSMIQERAYYYLLYQKFNTIINHWIKELQSTSYIKILKTNE